MQSSQSEDATRHAVVPAARPPAKQQTPLPAPTAPTGPLVELTHSHSIATRRQESPAEPPCKDDEIAARSPPTKKAQDQQGAAALAVAEAQQASHPIYATF